eukprot:jgi/Hompol1/3540/HPOL_006615-RA
MAFFQSTPVGIDASSGFLSDIPPAILEGRRLKLVPLDITATLDDDLETLHLISNVEQDAYRLQPPGPFPDSASYAKRLLEIHTDPKWLLFVIHSKDTGEVAGLVAFLNINNKYKTIEIGSIMTSLKLQGQKVALEATYLMLCYAAQCGYVRYEWKTHHLNVPSQRAAVSIGFTFEATFRKHMFFKGMVRHTMWYSIIDDEWPSVRARLEERIAELQPLVRKDA